jgi:hypothetical protein
VRLFNERHGKCNPYSNGAHFDSLNSNANGGIIMAAKHPNKQAHSQQQNSQHQSGKQEAHRPTTSAQHQPAKTEHAKEKDEAVRRADEEAQHAATKRKDRTAGQNEAVDEKRNDEQQYHAGGAAHDPHNRTQQRVEQGDPDAGDIDEETRSNAAPYNKTYGGHG